MTTTLSTSTEYARGYQAGIDAQRERDRVLSLLQIPVAYVGSPDVLECVARDGRHMTILERESISHCGVALYADPVAATRSIATLREFSWRLLNSLDVTARWLDNGGDPKQAADELRLNIEKLRELR